MSRWRAYYARLFLSAAVVILLFVCIVLAYLLGYARASETRARSGAESDSAVLSATVDLRFLPEGDSMSSDSPARDRVHADIGIPRELVSSSGGGERLYLIVVTGTITLIASLLTTCLGFGYAHIAARDARRFEWAKYLWGKDREFYLQFSRVLGATLDADVVQRRLEELTAKAFVPEDIRRAVDAYLAFLRGGGSPEEQVEKRESVCDQFEAFLSRPWDYV